MMRDLGKLVITRDVAKLLSDRDSMDFYVFITKCVIRYRMYDWGDLPGDDWEMNDRAVKTNDGRLFAAYRFPHWSSWTEGEEDRIWIITEADRSVTTILFPGDY